MTNAEKYKTAKERSDMMRVFCDKHVCCKCPVRRMDAFDCSFAWLEREAEEEKPLPCPFCGREIHGNSGHLRADQVHYWFECVSAECMYRSAHFLTEAEALAAHNRVASAVMATKEGKVKQ